MRETVSHRHSRHVDLASWKHLVSNEPTGVDGEEAAFQYLSY